MALTGQLVLDPLLAALVALNILWPGGLMDEAVPPELLSRIRAVISGYAEGALEAHDLRTPVLRLWDYPRPCSRALGRET